MSDNSEGEVERDGMGTVHVLLPTASAAGVMPIAMTATVSLSSVW